MSLVELSRMDNNGIDGSGTVLIVDDEPGLRHVFTRALERHGFECLSAGSSEEAWKILTSRAVALCLTDVNMPGGSGIELLRRVVTDLPTTATVMITGADDPTLALEALRIGAYGYITKPVSVNAVVINVVNALARRKLEIENRSHRERLEGMVQRRTKDLWAAVTRLEEAEQGIRAREEETIRRLAVAAEFRDDETATHVKRMSLYSELIARGLGMDAETCVGIRLASALHDIGKIGIPDAILLKPGPLTVAEREVMQGHAEIGHKILAGSDFEVLQSAAEIAATHHEWFDGSGYPNGLAGSQIPIPGRIAAVADVFDALSNDRVYRKAFPVDQAVEMMRTGVGSQFDPSVWKVFEASLDTAIAIRQENLRD